MSGSDKRVFQGVFQKFIIDRIFTGCILDNQGWKMSSFGQRRLIRLRRCAGLFESSLCENVRKYVYSRCGALILVSVVLLLQRWTWQIGILAMHSNHFSNFRFSSVWSGIRLQKYCNHWTVTSYASLGTTDTFIRAKYSMKYMYNPISILHKSRAGRYRPVRVADGPLSARCRFIKNASWEPNEPT